MVRARAKATARRPLGNATLSHDPRHPYGPANVLSGAAVYKLAVAAGFSSRPASAGGALRGPQPPGADSGYSEAAIATAIASAESGLDASVVNPASGATGLWQIHGPGQPRTGTRALINPAANALAAHGKKIAQGWGAWSTYTNGSYKSFLGSATSKPGAVKTGAVIQPPDILGGIFGKVIPLLKIAAGGTGLALTGIAIVYIAGRNTPAGAAIGAATNLVPGLGTAKAIATTAGTAGRAAQTKRVEARRELQRARVSTETGASGRERVRVTSTRSARAAQSRADAGPLRSSQRPRSIPGIRRSTRRPAIRSHAT